ncbi:hypothetical protein O7635_23530 [Asanoa sp. WMMD1127]|uniref:hypothetical protein n=1 Tax=Asanoa sp. WMMD1127 TaxID=3016107 RepID=UPI002415D22A|nr:hypothetical protein [Asanoa sp. WMMD1127]MDG4824831.1 hypothetical protein [Asanoa sp. WMMD1127]
MTTRWPDRATAERLLDGEHTDTPLGRVLTHARGPAAPHELLGEVDAAAVFRAGRDAPAPARGRRAVSRVLAVKVAVAGVLLTGSGLAVAGVTGTLPGPPPRDPPRPAPAERPVRPERSSEVRDERSRPAVAPRTPGPPPTASPTGHGKGPNEHTRSPHSHGNTAPQTPRRKNQTVIPGSTRR